MTLIGWGIVGSFLVSGIGFIASFISIRIGLRQIKKEESDRAIAHALVADHVDRLQVSLDHAHEKIRDLYSKSNDVNIVIAELRTTMQETNRVMGRVEDALLLLACVEERINGHIEAEKNKP